MMLAMPIATVSTLFSRFQLILNEFGYETSYIEKIISLAFWSYVEHQKMEHGCDLGVHVSINVSRSQ
jgi:hypothetical protein